MKTYDFENTIHASIERVWDVLHSPSDIISEWNAKIEPISNTQWKEIADGDLYNVFTASFKNDEYLLHIESVNSKYSSESNNIHINLKAIDSTTTKVSVHYEIKTGAIFNKISLALFGEKLAHHAEKVIMKNIEKKL
ncbi:hypothetical protein [Candidatus Stoquefichus massiliensis]|uniref:hypothetical protein n=1 Tax=Candidatus Stoquefichus massiliensis TaxID=1470350 RepID=UPI0004826E15|nr:hypothetical protein [Candidatus Stoquefichus massiliensis]